MEIELEEERTNADLLSERITWSREQVRGSCRRVDAWYCGERMLERLSLGTQSKEEAVFLTEHKQRSSRLYKPLGLVT